MAAPALQSSRVDDRLMADTSAYSSKPLDAVTVKYRGREGTAQIKSDNSFLFAPTKAGARACFPCSTASTAPLEVAGQDLIGAVAVAPDTVEVWSVPLEKTTAKKPTRRLRKTGGFQCKSSEAANSLIQRIRGAGQARRVTVIINPKSGPGTAPKIYEKRVAPILAAAGVQATVLLTQRAGHATELVQQMDLRGVDAVVCVGGDGTVFEVLQGYMKRPDWQDALRVPFCQVPGGSGNGLAASCGLWSPETAAHAICKGRSSAIDILSVLQPPGRRSYAFLGLNYGIIANSSIGTEHLRWMGGIRITLGLLYQLAAKRAYPAHVAIFPVPPPPASDPTHPTRGPASQPAAAVSADCPGGPPTPLIDSLQPGGPLEAGSLPPGWRALGPGPFQLFMMCNIPWVALDYNSAPNVRLDSGCFELHYTTDVTRKQGLEMILKAAEGQHMGLPYLHVEQVRAMVVEPLSSGTWLEVDGESQPLERMYLEVHPGMASTIVAS